MASTKKDWYARLDRIFRGPGVKRRIKDYRTPPTSTALELFSRSQSFIYSNAINAYGQYDRMSRLADFAEMDYQPEISAALNIFADETVSQDENGIILHVYSDNRKIRSLLEELFYDTLNVDFNLRMWVRNLTKYGDLFLFRDIAPGYGIVQVFPVPVNEVEREEGYDPEDPQAVRFRWVTQGNVALQNWQMSHFRLFGNDAFLPYGSSIIEPARRIWRQLVLLEDAMLVYRVVRSPERRVFYIDVGGIPPEEVANYMQMQESRLRSNTIVDRDTGRVDFRHLPIETLDDYFVPMRGGETSTRIDTLSGGQHVSATEDVEYIQRKLFAALQVPKAYLGFDEALCLVSDTLVPLIDGRTVTIEQLAAEYDEGRENWVYSYDLKHDRIVAGRVTNAWKTKEVDELYEVKLDDGMVVRCTENHPFLCHDGLYRRADELEVGQSLMPFYRCDSKKGIDGGQMDSHDMVFDPTRGKWIPMHCVIDWAGQTGLDEPAAAVTKGTNVLAKSKAVTKQDGALWNDLEFREKYFGENHWSWRKNVDYGIEWLREFCKKHKVTSINQWRKNYRDSVAKISPVGIRYVNNLIHRVGFANWAAFKKTIVYNHTVVAVRKVPVEGNAGTLGRTSVYDVSVEGWHNFAIQSPLDSKSGVFVHNSSKSTLAQEDIRFSRTIQQIQKAIVAELQELAYVHLFMNGYEGDDMFDFELRLNNPSSVAQQQKLELYARRFEIVGSAMEVGEGQVFSTPYLLRNIMNMSEQDQKYLNDELLEDIQRRSALAKVSEGATPESVGFGGGGGFSPPTAAADVDDEFDEDIPGGEEFTADDEGPPGDEDETDLEDLFQADAPEGTVLSDADDASDDDAAPKLLDTGTGDDDDDPVNVSSKSSTTSNRFKRAAATRKRNRKRSQARHGPAETHMPDFLRSTSMRDPQDAAVDMDGFNNPMRDSLLMKLEQLQRAHPSDGTAAKQRVDLLEKLSALDFLERYKGDFEPDPLPPKPRMTGHLEYIFQRLEDVFGEELAELRSSHDGDSLLTEADESSDDQQGELEEALLEAFNVSVEGARPDVQSDREEPDPVDIVLDGVDRPDDEVE